MLNLDAFKQTIKMRDGTEVLVRAMEAVDASVVLDFFRELPEDDRLFLRADVTKPEVVDRLVRGASDGTAYTLLAFLDDKVIGNATLYRNLFGWQTHVATLRVAVAHPCQHKGLGTLFGRLLIRMAINLGLDKVVAEAVDNQISAKRALEKLGFHQEAILKGHVKDINGTRRDLIIMSNEVAHIWETMERMVADFSPHSG